MPGQWLSGALVAALMGLAGCAADDSEPASLFAEDPAPPAAPPVPVQTVTSVELGRTRDGFIITALGTAPGLGYARPQLQPRREGAPGTDGYLDFDFVAVPPAPGFALPQGDPAARGLRADYAVRLRALRGAGGIRIHARDGGVQMQF